MLYQQDDHRSTFAREETQYRLEEFPQPIDTGTKGGMDIEYHDTGRQASQGATDERALRQVARCHRQAYMESVARFVSDLS